MRKENPFKIRSILWIDGLAALASAVAVLVFHRQFSVFLQLPLQLLLALSFISSCYAAYSLFLASQRIYARKFLLLLIIFNALYAAAVLVIAILLRDDSGYRGIVYLAGESVVVAALAWLEFTQLKYATR